MKNQLNIRMSDQAVERINALRGWLNESQTGVVTTAINQLYETERSKRMDIQALTETVARAIVRIQADGIEGWGLGNPDPGIFDVVETGPSVGCTSQTCNHVSHDPADTSYKLVPKSGKLISLGHDHESDETHVSYWALVSDGSTRYFRLSEERSYWARIRECDADEVPEWILAELAT